MSITHKTKNPKELFFNSKTNQAEIFMGFDYEQLSEMTLIIDHFVETTDLAFLNDGVISDSIIGGRPAVDNKMLLKIYLYSLHNDISIRKIENFYSVGAELHYLTYRKQFPKRSVFSKFIDVIEIKINKVFDCHLDYIKQLKIDFSITDIYADGTPFEARNSRNKIITDTNLVRSNIKWLNVIKNAKPKSTEHTHAASKLARNTQYAAKMALLKRSSFGRSDEDCIIIQDKNKSYMAGYNNLIFTEYNYGLIIHSHLSNKHPESEVFIECWPYVSNKFKVKKIGLDAGFATREIIKLLYQEKIKAFTKPRVIGDSKKVFSDYSFELTPDKKAMVCPNGEILKYQGQNKYGLQVYRSHRCSNCQFMSRCLIQGRVTKTIITDLSEFIAIQKSDKLINSSSGIKYYSHRGNKSESPHGHIKYNLNGKKLTTYGLNRNNAIIKCYCMLYNFSRVINLLKGA